MVEAGPRGDARVVKYTYTYTISDQWIEDRMDIEGIEMPKSWSISFSLADLPNPPERNRARRLWQMYQDIGQEPKLEAPTNDVLEFLNQFEEWAVLERERLAQEEHHRAQSEIDREIAVREFDREMADWIDRNGSPRMKTASKRGYKVTASYARARAREELPGCWVDTAGRAEFRERVDPSAGALQVESQLEDWLMASDLNLRIRIVWLTSPPSGLAERYEGIDIDEVIAGEVDEWEFEQQEAVLITGYLHRYEAYLMVNQELQAPTSADEEDD
jgi:hypothetical protein